MEPSRSPYASDIEKTKLSRSAKELEIVAENLYTGYSKVIP
jgi:hypothetical protein